MTDHIRTLSEMAPVFVSCYPNAGLPNEEGKYGETPQSLAQQLERFADHGWLNLVLVGVDCSPNSVPAIEVAFDEASRRKVELVAVHAFSDASELDLPAFGWEMGRQSAEADLAEALAGHAEQYPDVPVRRIVVANRPVRTLVDESASAQLLVVGSHGRGGFSSMLLGSTSNALLHSVEIPTIVVRA